MKEVWVLSEEEKPLYDSLYNRYRNDRYGTTERVSLTRRYLEGLPPYTDERQLFSRAERELLLESTPPEKQQVRPR